MKKAVLLGALTGAIVAFVWSFISWTVLPWYKTSFRSFTNSQEVANVIKNNAGCGQGVYLLPGCCGEQNEEQFRLAYQCGPIMFALVTPEGKDFNMVSNLIIQFITLFVAAGIISYIVASHAKKSYGSRLLIATLVGIFAAWMITVPGWNWWSAPAKFSVIQFFDQTIMWFLAGLAIARFARHAK